VRYFVPIDLYKAYWGAMNTVQEGHKYRKHIIVRRMPYAKGLLQLYTYHFPTHWSAACVANRELIKQAQRYAHALEHDHSYAALEWRMRFFRHYFRVCKCGHAPEPGLKAYSRFYQYAYVCIYRELKSEQQAAQEQKSTSLGAQNKNSASVSDISFSPIALDPARHYTPAFRSRTALRCITTFLVFFSKKVRARLCISIFFRIFAADLENQRINK
jgi:hypothetical protein